MKIAILEDNIEELQVLVSSVDIFFKAKNNQYTVKTYISVADLFDDLDEFDLLFLDIELGHGSNGIDIGLKIRKKNIDIKIIFITNFAQYSIAGYKVHADRYLLKSLSQTQFNIEMEAVLDGYLLKHAGFIDLKICKTKIYYKDIIYIEFKSRKTVIYFNNFKKMTTSYPLKYWINKLPKEIFAQPYQSFIINMDYISGFKKKDIFLMNEEYIPISRTYRKTFDDAYTTYIHRKM